MQLIIWAHKYTGKEYRRTTNKPKSLLKDIRKNKNLVLVEVLPAKNV